MVYNGLLIKSFKKIKFVQNTAARVITETSRLDHISPILRDLHWPPIKKHTDYKMMVLTFNALNDQGPSYIADFFILYTRKLNRAKRNCSDAEEKKEKTELYIRQKKKVQAIIRGEMHKYETKVTNDIKQDKSRGKKLWDNINKLRQNYLNT